MVYYLLNMKHGITRSFITHSQSNYLILICTFPIKGSNISNQYLIVWYIKEFWLLWLHVIVICYQHRRLHHITTLTSSSESPYRRLYRMRHAWVRIEESKNDILCPHAPFLLDHIMVITYRARQAMSMLLSIIFMTNAERKVF